MQRGSSAPSSNWDSAIAGINWRAHYRAAGSSVWRLPPSWRPRPNRCCSARPPPEAVPQRGARFGGESHGLSERGLTVLVSTHYMDEAERCDRIVYILNGKLIARGSVAEVIAQSGLITFLIEGENVRRLLHSLQHEPGVEYAAFFGAVLHVSGHDRRALERAVAKLRDQPGIRIEEAPPSLEDVFIHLQEQAQ